MIKRLSISNYALIDFVEINFDKGLHIVTGETGAGKSIILGALGLIMGDRADLKVISDPEKNCIIEADIDIRRYDISDLLNEWDIDQADMLNIRRVISGTGKSRAFINDLPVSLKALQDITIRLIQVHNQFDNLDLSQPDYQLSIIDVLGEHREQLQEYKSLYKNWSTLKTELASLKATVETFAKEKDFVRFQYEELENAGLEQAIDEELESSLELMSNAESIQQALKLAYFTLADDENSLIDQIKSLIRNLRQQAEGVSMVEKVIDSLDLEAENLEQIAIVCRDQSEKIDSDPEKLAVLQQKMDEINRLMHKFRTTEITELIGTKNSLKEKLNQELELDQLISEKEKSIMEQEKQLNLLAKMISTSRQKTSRSFCSDVENSLKQLAMPFVRLEGKFSVSDSLMPNGKDVFELLFSANKGTTPHPIKNVASGGELSRLSLSIKSILAGKMSLPTLIFDEIEAG
ncbi:MAG TPA: DNA repair protein RecN, partial [Saprospirales bacterium]|nr:DNA repair protein RecN [Saprospirales bacterium]HRQ30425.1 AAA family ATPase [Saprospiraceae bacterium]